MNTRPSHSTSSVDWVINYVEFDSRPVNAMEFRRLRMTEKEIQIAPCGISFTVDGAIEQGLVLQHGDETFHSSITERGNELILRIARPADSSGEAPEIADTILIVAKRYVGEFVPMPKQAKMLSYGTLSQWCDSRR